MSKGDLTREHIVSKAAELFNRLGYDGCSLSDIMQATGLKKGGIYNHFQNKDEIALAAFDYSFRKIIKRYREKTQDAESALEKIHAFVAMYESFYRKPVVQGGCPMMNTAIDATNKHTALRNKALEAFTTFKNYLTIKIKDGIDNGELKSKVDSSEAATFIMSTLNGALLMSHTYADGQYMTVAAKNLHEYIDLNLKK